MIESRLNKVLEKMEGEGLSQMLVTDPWSIFYLTDFYMNPMERFYGLLIKKGETPVFFLNNLFFVTQDTGTREVWYADSDPAMEIVAKEITPGEPLGVDKILPARFLLPLMQAAQASDYILASDCIDDARAIKDEEEQERMIEASRINDLAIGKVKELLHPGVTEREIADQMKAVYVSLGAEDNSFDPIIAFGENCADGHHVPDGTVLKEGDSVIFDVGCRKNGYVSDITRTFFWKTVSERDRQIYEIVLKAQRAAIEAVRPGVPICEIDATARDIITAEGYGKNFNHRLGHFLGMEVHEKGDVSLANQNRTVPGMVFSIEPGIYLAGEMGVRIEDLVLVTEDGCRRLNLCPKELEVVG